MKRRHRSLFCLVLLCLLLGGGLNAHGQFTNVFTVTNTNDSGPGSLREAVASTLAGDNNVINFASGVTGTINLTSGELVVTTFTTINGPGANVLSISAQFNSRVFNLQSLNDPGFMTYIVTISGLTIRDGLPAANPQNGGAIYSGDTVFLSLSNCTIYNSAGVWGGGLYTLNGNVTVSDCTFIGNGAVGPSGIGGAIFYHKTNALVVSLAITGSTFVGNVAADGGAIFIYADTGHASVTATNCTISGNSATEAGGGITNEGNNANATLTLNNCTLANNSAPNGRGGAIDNGGNSGLAYVYFRNTIFKAGTSGQNIFAGAHSIITSQGYNLSSDNGSGFFAATGDQSNTDPQLGPLQNNGGPTLTLTHALLGNSPAIDAGDPNFDPNSFNPPLVNDQRGPGFPRVIKSRIDIGAFEYPLLVTNTTDSGPGSLRQALIDVRDGVPVQFAPGLTGTITLSSGQLVVNNTTSIIGPGANILSVSGNNASRVFSISPGKTVTISGLTIQNGNAAGNNGGGIYNDRSNLTLDSCTLSNNSANNGGAAFNDAGSGGSGNATMTVANCTLNANQATVGGALYNAVVSGGQAILTVVNSTLSGNTADAAGGIANVDFSGTASLTVANSTLNGNSANSGDGGGIYNIDQVSISNTILKTGAAGGNIFNQGGTVTSLGYNLSNDAAGGDGTTAPGGFLNATGDQRNTNPQIGPLQNNGGPTFTHALLSGSPAFQAGNPGFNPNAFTPPLVNDQRGPGFPRIFNNRIDIGAFEGRTIPVANHNDAGANSLRQALSDAGPGATVEFTTGAAGTITLTSGELLVNKDVTITGPGANILSVSGNNASRVLHITPGLNVAITGLTIKNGNASSDGGGILNERSNLTIRYCTLADNSAEGGSGGAIYNKGQSTSLTITGCTINDNSAGNAGGIYNDGNSSSVLLEVANTTFSGNSAANVGGGIVNDSANGIAIVTLNNNTFNGNSAGFAGGGIFNFLMGGTATVSFHNTLLKAGSSGGNIANSNGAIVSAGYNLSSDAAGGDGGTGPGGFLNAAGDIRNTDPQLGPLQNNGGPTLTHALSSGSPAINAGQPDFSPDGFTPPLNNDQRGPGFMRVVNGRLDIGAYETRVMVTNTTNSGAGSLRQALIDVVSGAAIEFAPGVSGLITLSSGELTVNKDCTILGPGANVVSVSGNNASRVFHITPGRIVTISGLTIQNGNTTGGSGGGIYNNGSSLTVDSCTLSNNSAGAGGAAFNDAGSGNATMTLANCTLNANQASIGGALCNETVSGGGGQGLLTVVNSTLSGNTADTAGGGIANVDFSGTASLTVTVSNSTLNGNSANSGDGGGIYNNAQVSIGNTILKTGAAGGNIFNDLNGGGVVTSLGYNLSNDNSGGGALGATGDQINTDPMLGPLKNNGGPTLTHAPLINSPAIDQGKRDAIPALTTNFDQRGSARPVSDPSVVNFADGSDIGAVEIGQFVHPTDAASRKTHGGAGSFPISLPLTGPVGIECRSGGASNVYQVILNFAGPVSFSTPAVVTSGSGSVASSTGNGTNQITLNLSGVTNAQTITLALFGVSDGVNIADVGIRMGMLLGDTGGNGTVNSTDVSETKLRSGQVLSAANFRSDVNASGAINATDVSTVKLRSGSSLP